MTVPCAGRPDYVSLSEALGPIWKLTHYGRVLPDWFRPTAATTASRVATWTGTALALALIGLLVIFEFLQLISEGMEFRSIHTIILNILWFSTFSMTFLCHLHYVIKRNHYLKFFEDWTRLENRFMSQYSRKSLTKKYILLYVSYSIMAVVTVAGVGLMVFFQPEASFIPSSLSGFRRVFSAPLLGALHVVGLFYAVVSEMLSSTVPALTYHHMASALESLELETIRRFHGVSSTETSGSSQSSWTSCTSLQDAFNAIWTKYERLRRTADRANDLFGLLLLASHGFQFTMICSFAYSILYRFKQTDQLTSFIFCTNVLMFAYRLVVSVLLTDRLHRSWRRYAAAVAVAVNHSYSGMSDREMLMASILLNHIETNPLIASPLDLYRVDRCTLLRMLSLVVSYIVILLQSS